MDSMRSLVVGAAFLAAAHGVALSGASQSGTSASDKKPNIAVSGCLMRQGYATLIVADARLDATGEKAATAAPSPDPPPETSQTPPKWVLENAGVIGQHVGERVQVVGASDWVANKSAPAPSEPGGPPPELPHIDVLTVKVLAPKCT
jgi:hypothetical protein